MTLRKGYPGWVVLIVLLCLSTFALGQPQSNGPRPVEKLATDLVNTATQRERLGLLAANKRLVTPELRKALVAQGNSFLLKRHYAQAQDIYRLSLAIAEEIGDKFGIAQSRQYMGIAYYAQGNDVLALENLQAALKLFEDLDDKLETGRTLVSTALVKKNQEQPAKAIDLLQKALNYFELLNNKEEIVNVLNTVGGIYLAQSESSLASKSFRQSLALDPAGKNLFDVASTFYFQGNYDQAIVYYQKALAYFQQKGNQLGIGDALASLGNACYNQGNYDLALEYYQRLLAIQEKLGQGSEISTTLLTLGEINFARGNLSLALANYQRSLELAEQSGNKIAAALRRANIALIRDLQGNDEVALQYYEKCLELLKGSEVLALRARVWASIGHIYYGQSKYDLALSAYQTSLKVRETMADKAGAARVLQNLGMVYVANGQNGQALAVYQRALAQFVALGNNTEQARAMTNIAMVQALDGNNDQALSSIKEALGLAKQSSNLEVLWLAHSQAGKIYDGLSQPLKARQEFDEAIKVLEEMQARIPGGEQGFEGNKVYPYLAAAQLLIDEGKALEALNYAEQAKLQTLRSLISKARITKTLTPDEQKEESRVTSGLVSLTAQVDRESDSEQPNKSRIDVLNSQLQKVQKDYEAFHERLYAAHPRLKMLRGETAPLRLAGSGSLFTDIKSAMLEFVVTENKTYLFVLTPEETSEMGGRPKNASASSVRAPVLKVYTLPVQRRDLAERIERFRQLIGLRDGSFGRLARELYDLLLKPAESQLTGKRELVIVPDQELWNLPFQALEPADNHFLIEDHAISYASSLSALSEMMKQRYQRPKTRAAESTLLAFGNATPEAGIVSLLQLTYRNEIKPIPRLETEVQGLGKLYASGQSKVLVGSEANEFQAKEEAGRYRILHFAARTVLDDVTPMYSSVALSPGRGNNREDGLLQAWEVMGLDLRAELVLLSSSSIARGQTGAGGGIIGTTWAWFVAGSPTVVLSAWDLDSAASTDLMTEFHRKLNSDSRNSKRRASKAEALRQAAIDLLRTGTYQHPYYWAGFMLVGDGR